MSDPLTCPACGGHRPAYRSVRSLRFTTQYRRCDRCGQTSKTRRWLSPAPRQLTASEISTIASLLPDQAEMVTGPETHDVFIVVRRRELQ